jgi:heptosyltransferase-2
MAVSFHQPPRRILVRGVNWLGDAVMTTPALLRLREKFPQAHITLLGPEKLRELWGRHPAVNDVIGFDVGEGLLATSRKLRTGKFELALVLPNSPRSALEVWLAGIPQRVGYARPWRTWFLTQAVPTRRGHVKMCKRTPAAIRQLTQNSGAKPEIRNSIPETAHQLHEYLHLVATLGTTAGILAPQLTVGSEEVQAVAGRFGLGLETRWLGINPGAEYGPAKRWPVENFQFMAREAAAWPGWGVLLFGGKADMAMAGRIEQEFWNGARHWTTPPKLVNLAGRTSLRELMALLKLCRGVLTNDTGPMHVAAALGTPVVVPFGSTSPELTGPGLPGDPRHRLLKSDAVCSPCFLRECPIDFRCMNGITVERVMAAALDVFHH